MNIVAKCPHCGYTCAFRHMHDSPYGMEGAHMSGSERFECSQCGHSVSLHSPGAEQFKFILDGRKANATG
jgi:hypothetical protein